MTCLYWLLGLAVFVGWVALWLHTDSPTDTDWGPF